MTDPSLCRSISLANPRAEGGDDLALLLRRLADLIDEMQIDPMDVLDLTIAYEIDADGPWFSGTLYWAPDE